MTNEHKTYKFAHKASFGPGGRKCRCCLPHIALDKLNRYIRRKMKQALMRDLYD